MLKQLAETIATETEIVAVFVRLLQEEQEALTSGNADALTGIVEEKTATAIKLSPVVTARNAGFIRAGAASGNAGITIFLAARPDDDPLKLRWQKLQELVAEASELNRVNGRLIHLRLQATSQALEALIAATHRHDLYGADGQATTGISSRIIDSA